MDFLWMAIWMVAKSDPKRGSPSVKHEAFAVVFIMLNKQRCASGFPSLFRGFAKITFTLGYTLGCPSDGVAYATAATYRTAWGEMRSAVNAYIFGFALHEKEHVLH